MLSPTLFSIFINDLPLEHKKYSRYSLLFADDLVKLYLFRNTCKTETIENEINKDLAKFSTWTNNWRLTIAANKSSYMCFKKFKLDEKEKSVKRKREVKDTNINKAYSLNLKVNDKSLPNEKVVKFLGIRFDEYCRFDHQIKHIKSVVTDRLNILKIISHKSWNLSLTTLKQTYISLIRSVIEYSSFLLPVISEKFVITLRVI